MKLNENNNQGFSIIIAVFMVGFLLVLTTGIFNLVLKEMSSNKGSESYLKAYAGAEGAMELGLLSVKKNGYGFDKDLKNSSSGSEVLSFGSSFNIAEDPHISYEMDIKMQSFSGSIGTGATVIIPLFWKGDSASGQSAKQIELLLNSHETDIIWNIIGGGEGVSGLGEFNYNDIIEYRTKEGSFVTSGDAETIEDFLLKDGNPSGAYNLESYLVLFNKNISSDITYQLKVSGVNEFFSSPMGVITSSAKVGKYKQNISTTIDNTEFLKMLKYSIYSN